MEKGLGYVVALVAVVTMLWGCAAAGSAVESEAEVAGTTESGIQAECEPPAPEEPAPESVASSVPVGEPTDDTQEDGDTPTLAFETSYTDLSFLNEEQRAAFTFVMENYKYLGYGNDGWEAYRNEDGSLETAEVEGKTYYLSGRGLHEWQDFYAYWTEGFEKEYFDSLLEKWGSFIEYDGKAWTLDGGASGNGLLTVGYEISKITDEYIVFYIKSYGNILLGMENELTSQHFDKVTLSLTEDGWRCTDFPWI